MFARTTALVVASAALLTSAGQVAGASAPVRPGDPDVIRPGDRLHIRVADTLPEAPIRGVFRVEPSGKVALGPEYGRVQIKGLTLEQAEEAIDKHLRAMLKQPKVQVTHYDPEAPGAERTLEERIRQLEKEVRELRAAVETLQKRRD